MICLLMILTENSIPVSLCLAILTLPTFPLPRSLPTSNSEILSFLGSLLVVG
jgi:hypothetical protein